MPLVADESGDCNDDDDSDDELSIPFQRNKVANRVYNIKRLLRNVRNICWVLSFVISFIIIIFFGLYFTHTKPFVDYSKEPRPALHEAVELTNTPNKTVGRKKMFQKTIEWTKLFAGFGMSTHL